MYRSIYFSIRAYGSAAIHLVYVAEGAVDAFLEYGIHCWDIAAAALIVLESGGVLIDPTGQQQPAINYHF